MVFTCTREFHSRIPADLPPIDSGNQNPVSLGSNTFDRLLLKVVSGSGGW
jgi:hypothetical protein